MKTEVRFLLAIGLMLLVLVGTNKLFPPIVPEPLPPGPDGAETPGEVVTEPGEVPDAEERPAPRIPPPVTEPEEGPEEGPEPLATERRVSVEGPLYRFEFSTLGARLTSAEMSQFQSLSQEGVVDLVPEDAGGYLGHRLLVGSDTVDLSRVPYRVEPEDGLHLVAGGVRDTLRFAYEHPTGDFRFEVAYAFHPDMYEVDVRGRVVGVDRPLLVTDLGAGLAFAEADSAGEARMMAYVHNHVQNGIRSITLHDAEPAVVEGPLMWAAFRSKFFVLALLAGETDAELAGATSYLGGLIVSRSPMEERVRVAAAQSVRADGRFAYRLFIGPQDYTRLSSLGQGMEEVNPYGWRFFRPIVRPFVSIIMAILVFLHTQLSLGYGWVLIVFGVLMRIVLFPLNQKAMKAQLRNMAVQPLVQEIQKKHKDNPEKLQKEMMRLYKEHGFNPLAGCLPLLLPWPVLIALFFVFQNTIELRGVPFLWLSDLSAKDPFYILPIILAVSMFLMQWVSMRSIEQVNPQMKMMMWMMPGIMLFVFMNLASGLNLYYATANIATIPQQIWIANERKKMKGKPPPKLDSE
jgi:YidC/Oxa1 family membrane protein insertase